ncbi:hypothetical protein F4677DRAFT_451412 [Hypoxylon crocopeplum]|nr:hypothetical protein F4677DRAFT_451412 [Hypoxylon crocopeplum]
MSSLIYLDVPTADEMVANPGQIEDIMERIHDVIEAADICKTRAEAGVLTEDEAQNLNKWRDNFVDQQHNTLCLGKLLVEEDLELQGQISEAIEVLEELRTITY